MMTIREQTEAIEAKILSEFACRAAKTRGRLMPEEPCKIRTEFQRDRDRIVHACKSFRRLAYKTQCFIGRGQDHIRTRLTHTLEVCQIGRTVARALRLNEDLTEAIALGHDLGHTPFGHAGEFALDQVLKEAGLSGGFRHYEQSLRVVDELEKDGLGVNLTFETRNGIRHHSKGERDLTPIIEDPDLETLEGHVIKWADRVAYANHDLDDAIRASVISGEDIPKGVIRVLGERHSVRINTLVSDLIRCSSSQPRLAMSEHICSALNELKDFLFENVYFGVSRVGVQERRAQGIVRGLFQYYMDNPEEAPFLTDETKAFPGEQRLRPTTDYVAGMTDRFACERFVSLCVPDGYV